MTTHFLVLISKKLFLFPKKVKKKKVLDQLRYPKFLKLARIFVQILLLDVSIFHKFFCLETEVQIYIEHEGNDLAKLIIF